MTGASGQIEGEAKVQRMGSVRTGSRDGPSEHRRASMGPAAGQAGAREPESLLTGAWELGSITRGSTRRVGRGSSGESRLAHRTCCRIISRRSQDFRRESDTRREEETLMGRSSEARGMLKWLPHVLVTLSLPVALLLGTPLHDWIDDVGQGTDSAGIILWAGVLICAAGVVVATSLALHFLERAVIRRRAANLGRLLDIAAMCSQSGWHLHTEAAAETNTEVLFAHYCELGRMVRDQLELVRRGGDASVVAMGMTGLDTTAAEELMVTAGYHYGVEIAGPLGTKPSNITDKMTRIQEAGYGGRCVALIVDQLTDVLTRVKGDAGIGGTDGT